jgi:hypothetical protein
MDKYCCVKCAEVLDNKINKNNEIIECDCIIDSTDYDDYVYSKSMECPCDETDYTCNRCQDLSYASYKNQSRMITIECCKCKISTTSCCYGGYYKI